MQRQRIRRNSGAQPPEDRIHRHFWFWFFAAVLCAAMATAVVSGVNRSETWRGVETALLFALPVWTWAQQKAYAASTEDMSALAQGLPSRRWLAENLLCLVHIVLLLGECITFAVVDVPSKGYADNADNLLTTCFLLIDLAVVVYSAVLVRLLGNFRDPAECVPRHARPELRSSRYLAYLTSLNRRMGIMRAWWLLRAVLVCIAGADKLVGAVAAQFFAAAGGGGFSPTHPFLTFYPEPVARAVHRVGTVLFHALLRDHYGALAGSPVQADASMSWNFNLARAVVAALSATLLPLALGALSAASLCCWRARDYAAHLQSGAQLEWQWDAGSVGEHPAQALPPRLPAAGPAAAAAPAAEAAPAAVAPPSQSRCGRSGGSGSVAEPPAAPAPPASAPAPASAVPDDPLAAYLATGALVAHHAAAAASAPQPGVPRRFPDSTALLAPRPLRVVILTVGTRGDVQPYCALGVALREAGHSVVISATSDFKDFVEGYGLAFADTRAPRIAQPDEWLRIHSVADMIRVSGPQMVADYAAVADAFHAACTVPVRADVVVGTAMTVTMALDISEAEGIPCWVAKLAPDLPTAGFTTPGSEPSRVGWLNLARCYAYWLNVARATDTAGLAAAENRWRAASLGLGPPPTAERVADMRLTPQLLGFSQHLFPKPADYPAWAFQAGFWMLSEADEYHRRADPRLLRFFEGPPTAAGAPAKVAAVTFGSMLLSARPSLTADIVHELLRAGYRVLLLTGWAATVPAEFASHPHVCAVKEAPHDWVFAGGRVALAVHHGGAGTTGRALASGVPSLVVPVLRFADQLMWGRMVAAAGAGVVVTEPNPSRAALRAAIARVKAPPPPAGSASAASASAASAAASPSSFTHTAAGDRADVLGCRVRAECGAETAIALLEACLCNTVLPPHAADAIHPLAGPLPAALSPEQRMCVRHCLPCRRLRARLGLADTPLFRLGLPARAGGGAGAAAASSSSNAVRVFMSSSTPPPSPRASTSPRAEATVAPLTAAAHAHAEGAMPPQQQKQQPPPRRRRQRSPAAAADARKQL